MVIEEAAALSQSTGAARAAEPAFGRATQGDLDVLDRSTVPVTAASGEAALSAGAAQVTDGKVGGERQRRPVCEGPAGAVEDAAAVGRTARASEPAPAAERRAPDTAFESVRGAVA